MGNKKSGIIVTDLSAVPYTYKGLEIISHLPSPIDIKDFDPEKLGLYFFEGNKARMSVKPTLFLEELRDRKLILLNANFRDLLLEKPELTPSSYKDRDVSFFGDIFKNREKFEVAQLTPSSRFMGREYRSYCEKTEWLDMLGDCGGFPAAIYLG
jgi:hypothetical protein